MERQLTQFPSPLDHSSPSDPPPLAWDDYAPLVRREWLELLAADATAEPEVVDFLRRNPAMVPGVSGFEGGHHGAIHHALFIEPQLPGIRRPVPDLMWVVRDTEAVRPILIEIESPKKRWFKNKSGLPTDGLHQAIGQLSDWRAWFAEPANVINFRKLYDLNGDPWGHRALKPTYCLIYGRQAEFDSADAINKRAGLRPRDTVWMTYDGLQPDDYARDVMTVQVHVDGRWNAIEAAPTLRWGRSEARAFRRLRDVDGAIMRNAYMTEERKRFMVNLRPKWDAWVDAQTRSGIEDNRRM